MLLDLCVNDIMYSVFRAYKTAHNESIMSYDVGQYIDLTYLNKKHVGSEKKSDSETSRTLFEVGTQFIFSLTPQGFKAAIRIPVAFA